MANNLESLDYELQKRFTYHAPKPGQQERYETIREIARGFAGFIGEHCPDSRERAMALTKLEECVMWANASIARNE